MAAKKKDSGRRAEAEAILENLTEPVKVTPDDKHTGTVAARHKAEAARQKAAKAERARIVAEA